MKEGLANFMSLGTTLGEQAERFGDRPFLNFKGQMQVPYSRLNDMSLRFGAGFLESGVRKGTKVAIMLPNCPEYLYSWFGLASIGAVMVPVNTAHKGDLLGYIIDSSDTEVIVTSPEFLDRTLEALPPAKQVRQIFVLDGSASATSGGAKISPLSDLSSAGKLQQALTEVKHSDPMSILFTSGTTGPSKGVVMSHNYYHYAAMTIGSGMAVGQGDVLFTCLPLFHVNAQVCTVLSALVFGARVAMYQHFSATTFWDEVRSSEATVFLALGAMGNILYKAPPSSDDSKNNVRLAMVVPPPENLEDFEKRFALRVLYETFGLTEGIVAAPSMDERRRPGCCGKPAKDVEVMIVDDDDRALPPGQTGEIVMRTRQPYSMMTEYYKMPEETLRSFRNLWFHTGDLGWLDEEGYLYFVGRKKEAIRRRGENISAFEVEKIVNQHPSVLESAALAVPSELGEDDVKVVLVLKEGQSLDPESLLSFCEDRMAYFMVPRFIEFREALPKTPTQRVEKYKLQRDGNTAATYDREAAGYRLSRQR
jgi:crotonobetaine/carnitine-CoA ligase